MLANRGSRRDSRNGLELISSNQAMKEIEVGATFFMIVA